MKTNVITLQNSEVTYESISSVSEIKKDLAEIEYLYPNFNSWLYFRFQKSSIEKEFRKILVARKDGEIAGVSLLKKHNSERKICTFFITPSFRGENIGTELMKKSLDWLETTSATISVSEERHSVLKPLLKKFNFKLSQTKNGYYRKDINEYFYTSE